MSSARFDILFSGKMLPGADPAEVRRQLQAIFRISGADADRLFSGNPVTVKRDADEATVARFREVFREAGALVRVVPAGGAEELTASDAEEESSAAPAQTQQDATPPRVPDSSYLQLAPQDDTTPLEAPMAVTARFIDVSHLSLITGDWTLADCDPPIELIRLPDVSHLTLVLPQEDPAAGPASDSREP